MFSENSFNIFFKWLQSNKRQATEGESLRLVEKTHLQLDRVQLTVLQELFL